MKSPGRVTAGLCALLLAVILQAATAAHSGLRFSSPLEGSALGAAPTHIQLTFIERPEPSLATIRVSSVAGETFQIGLPETVSGDPLSLTIPLRAMPKGVYVVNWRVVSAVDGHATAGAFAFGVQMEPTALPPAAVAETPDPLLEIIARTVFLLSLIVMVGAATYAMLRLGEAPWLRFAIAGTIGAVAGLIVLIAAQSRASDTGLWSLVDTPIGRAWTERALAIGVAIIGIAIATTMKSVRWFGALVIGLSAAGAIAVHAFAGHAAAGRLPVTSTVIFQAVHVIAAGAWLGGLAIVIAGLRSRADDAHPQALRRFSALAALGLALVTITGVARSIHEVGEWRELATTTYGRLVMAKAALLTAIAILGALNRWRYLPALASGTRPLQRSAAGEIALAILAIVTAGALATLSPPAAAVGLPGIEVSGADFATTVRATFTAVSDQPGPNRFGVVVEDYDSRESISPDRVTLRFTPIDDPEVEPTTLALSQEAGGAFAGTGANVAFDGRWRVNVLIERGTSSVDVPLDIEARGRPQSLTALRVANQKSIYALAVGNIGSVQYIFDHEQPGETQLQISCFTVFSEPLPVRNMIVTTATNDGSAVETLAITRQDRHQFAGRITLRNGVNRISVIARTETDARLRATFELPLPE